MLSICRKFSRCYNLGANLHVQFILTYISHMLLCRFMLADLKYRPIVVATTTSWMVSNKASYVYKQLR